MQFIERKAEFQAVLPSNCTFERFARTVKTGVIQNPELLTADRTSLFMSCFRAAQDGLLPDGRDAALVIYNTKQKDGSYKKMVQYMPMIGGVLKKVRNSGELASISAHVVYDKDEFDYCLGDDEHITHKPAVGDRGNPICAYAIVKTKDNAIYREVMSVNEIEKIRSLSRSKDGQAWKDHWAEMAKKTVLRRISKRLPMSTDLEQVINRDNEMFEFHNKSKLINTTVDTINKHIIDISDSVEIDEKLISSEIETKPNSLNKDVNNAKTN
ncbi:MAG: recombinase RecT [Neisseriaceae bacterium]